MELNELSIKVGDIEQILPLFDPSTIQHSFEIMNYRRKDESLRNRYFLTADCCMYRMEKDSFSGEIQPILYITDRENNLIFNNINESMRQIRSCSLYRPPQKEVQKVVESAKEGSSLRIPLFSLRLRNPFFEDFALFNINTTKYDKLNDYERQFAEKICGEGEDFIKNMAMLKSHGLKKISVNLRDIHSLKELIQKKGVEGSDSVCSQFYLKGIAAYNPLFDAFSSGYHSSILGKLRSPEELSSDKSIDEYSQSFDMILNNPDAATKRINPQIASGLSNILSQYLEGIKDE